MLSIKTTVPPYLQLKLHIEAQISSDVLVLCDQFVQEESSNCDEFLYFGCRMIEILAW